MQVFSEHGQKLFDFRKTPRAEDISKYLDGKKSTKEIFDAIMALPAAGRTRPTYEHLLREFEEIYGALSINGWLFLRAPTIAAFKTMPEMQKRIAQYYSR